MYLFEEKSSNFPENAAEEKHNTSENQQETEEISSFCEGFKIHVVKSA